MEFDVLTETNFTMYAVTNYDNPHCEGEDEFIEDLYRFISLKRLLIKYSNTGELKERSKILAACNNGLGIHNRNMKLVRLPLPYVGKYLPEIQEDDATEQKKLKVQIKLGIRHKRQASKKYVGFDIK